jgi:hypothetical protein
MDMMVESVSSSGVVLDSRLVEDVMTSSNVGSSEVNRNSVGVSLSSQVI